MNAESVSIIIVENQPLMLTALSTALMAEGMTILAEVSNSARAIPTVGRFNPRLVLFAVGQPALPDLERISALRHEFPRLLILALVSGDFRGQERMALDYGAHCAIAKTTPRAELVAAVKELSTQFIAASPTEAAPGH
jgi:DNA-binding NarL/FixJ family response regulator